MDNPARRPDLPPPNATEFEIASFYNEMMLWADTWDCIVGVAIWLAVLAVAIVSGIALGVVLSV